MGSAAAGVCLLTLSLGAEEIGTASGKGVIERLLPPKTSGGENGSEMVGFSPRYCYTYREGTGTKAYTWLVLTEKEPPVKEWTTAKDRAEARRLWCEKEKASFTAVKLDAQMRVDLYFLCPANGLVNTEMLNTANGLDSVVLKFEAGNGKRLKGTLRTGQGNCPRDGKDAYCTPTGDYAFDAPLSK
jgi:hypothetical protein